MDSSRTFSPNDLQKTSSSRFLNLSKSTKNNRFLSIGEFKEKLEADSARKPNLKLSNLSGKVLHSFRKSNNSFRSDAISTVSSFLPNTTREAQTMTCLYNFSCGESLAKNDDGRKFLNGLQMADKKQIMAKYNLSVNMKQKEKQDIDEKIKTDRKYTNSVHINSNIYTSGDIVFSSPYNSYQNLKLNQQICEQYNNIFKDLKTNAKAERGV